MSDYGSTLAVLWAAHNLGDHVIQTDHQAAHKTHSWKAMTGHVGSYTATQVAALLGLRTLTGGRGGWRRLAAGVAFSAATHAFLDRRWPVTRLLAATGSAAFAERTDPICGSYLADQALHHACLAVSAALITGRETA